MTNISSRRGTYSQCIVWFVSGRGCCLYWFISEAVMNSWAAENRLNQAVRIPSRKNNGRSVIAGTQLG